MWLWGGWVTEAGILPEFVFHVRVLRQGHVVVVVEGLRHGVVGELEQAQGLDAEVAAAVAADVRVRHRRLRGVERARRGAGRDLRGEGGAGVGAGLEVGPRRLGESLGDAARAVRQVDFEVAAVARAAEPRAPRPRAHGRALARALP
jgi:hypothetical protein